MANPTSAELKHLQSGLSALELYPVDEIDGVWGPKIYSGLKQAIGLASLAPPKEPDPVPIPVKPTVNYRLALELAFHEAVVRQAYLDSAGRWTWSVGLTSATGHDVKRYIGVKQPMQRCMDIYVWALRNYAIQVEAAFVGFPLTQNQFAAAVSFHWNTGAIRRASWVKKVKEGDLDAEDSFLEWRMSKGKVVPALEERRVMEWDLWSRNRWSNNGTILEYTRLTARNTPVWASAVRVSIEKELMQAFGSNVTPILDAPAQPFVEAPVPTLTARPA